MGFLSDLNRKRKKVQKKILNPIVKGVSKISDKLIPNELRFLAPYAAGIGSLMLPPGMGPMMRGLMSAGFNAAGQIGANETPIEDISDLNKLSMALAGGLGALGSQDVTKGGASGEGIRGGIDSGTTAREAARMQASGVEPSSGVGFLQGAENVGREGIASLSDYVQGTRSTLADVGKDPGSLFSSANKFKTARDAAGALGPTLTLGTGDVAYEAAIDAQNLFNETEAEELRQAGMDEDAISNARRVAIREAMESAQFTDQEILDTLAEIGLKDGGIASLKNGGILGFNDGGPVVAPRDRVNNYLGYRPEDFNEKLGTFQDGTTISDRQMPMGLGIPPSGNYADNFSNQSPKTLTVDNTDNSNPYSNDKRRENVIQAMMAAKHSQATIDEALGELGLKNGGIIGLKDGGMLNFGGREMDLRSGGFVPIGKKERADDVPARLSKNEFVMTADAVRAAGGGSVNKGAQRMYDIMNRLEAQV